MSEMGETVAKLLPKASEHYECPFEHEGPREVKPNVLPPPDTKNNATELGKNLDEDLDTTVTLPITPGGRRSTETTPFAVHFTGHHLLPGNASWPNTSLYRWIDERGKHVNGDIGYDVNAKANGVFLPGQRGYNQDRERKPSLPDWDACDEEFRRQYAFAAMKAKGSRQFHDSHPAYSDFVVQCLNKIAAELEACKGGPAGCGEDDCPGNRKRGRFDPPYNLLPRLEALAERLRPKLRGRVRDWRPPLMTSRFALMLKNRMLSEEEATEKLGADNFTYEGRTGDIRELNAERARKLNKIP